MTKSQAAALACLAIGLLIAVIGPFNEYGDSIKLGLGGLMNGGIALAFLLLSPVVALIARKKT